MNYKNNNMNKTSKIKLEDIAREAGVSVTTASFYINGKAKKYKLSAKTCEKIEKVIEKYNYVPNIHARAMQTNKTFLIGVIVPGSVNRSFWIDIIAGIEEVVSKYKYHLILSISHFNQEEELEAFKFMHSKGVDGYIFCPVLNGHGAPKTKKYLDNLKKEKPVACITFPYDGLASIYNDNKQGGQKVAEYLFSKGHRKVAYIGHLDKSFDLRGRAFIDFFKSKGCSPDSFTDSTEFMANAKKYTAVFCYSDYFLLDIYSKAAASGLSIPDELSVIGYDNLDFLDSMIPRPATVNQQKQEIGRAAGKFMMKVLEQREAYSSEHIKFIPEIVEGGSIKELL
jgi:LacI family transcriptional regulator